MRKIKYKNGIKVQPTFLEYTGRHKNSSTEMQLFVYNDFELLEYQDIKINHLEQNMDLFKTNWLNVHGLNEIEIIQSIGTFLKVDYFMLGDILNTTKRTKLEEYHDFIFQYKIHVAIRKSRYY
jgi:magnesium transporter